MHVINHTEPVAVPADDTVAECLLPIGPNDRRLSPEVLGIVAPD